MVTLMTTCDAWDGVKTNQSLEFVSAYGSKLVNTNLVEVVLGLSMSEERNKT